MWDSHHLPLAVSILGKLYFSYSLIFNLNVCVSLRLISPVDSGCKSKSSSTGAEVGKSATSLSKVSGIPKQADGWQSNLFQLPFQRQERLGNTIPAKDKDKDKDKDTLP